MNKELVTSLDGIARALAADADHVTLEATAGTNGSYFIIGEILVCFGTDYVLNAGTTLSFGKTFASLPVVVATILDTNNQAAWVSGRTTTSCVLKQLYTATSLPVCWIAVGRYQQ